MVQKKIFISIAHETMILQPTCFKSFQKKERKENETKQKQTNKKVVSYFMAQHGLN